MLRYLCFDLDGTLTDSRQGIVFSFCRGLRAVSAPVRDEQGFYDFVIGPPLSESYRALGVPEERIRDAIDAYRAYYAIEGLYECRVYDGVAEALCRLRAAGARLFVVTAKPEVYARRIIERFFPDGLFEDIIGPTLKASEQPKEELLRILLTRHGITPSAEVAMIGDRLYDAEAARAVGVTAVGVSWGFGSEQELAEAGVDMLWENPSEIQL